MMRFWRAATAEAVAGGFIVLLDGKPMRLPGNVQLVVPMAELASAIATEWEAVSGRFTPDDLPLTRLATTAQERVRAARGQIIMQLVAYGMNDLLCYRAANDPALAAREAEIWQPWLDWAALALGAELRVTQGVIPVAQPAAAAAAFASALEQYDEYQLAGLGVIIPALGSLVLGLALAADRLCPESACAASQLGEHWQEAKWGVDAEAAARRALVQEDVAQCARFMALCRG